MHIESVSHNYHKLPPKNQQRFILNLRMLFDQEFCALALRGPFRLVLDSNVLMRFEDVAGGVTSEGLLAVLCFFDYFKAQDHYRADLLIRPSVFYEYCHHRAFGALSKHWEAFKALRDSIERALDIEVLFDGIAHFHDAEARFSAIERDASIIRQALISIQARDWRYDFIRPRGGVTGVMRHDLDIEVPPSSAAEHLYGGIATEYFSSHYVGLFLRDHIAYALANNPKNDRAVAEKYEDPNGYNLRRVLYLNEKKALRGLADIELFSLCNTNAQFHAQASGQYWPASIPLTVDEDLYLNLARRSGFSVSSAHIVGGEPQSEMLAKLESWSSDAQRRTKRAEEQQRRCLEAQHKYLKSIRHLFSSET
jgi:hypothetical protein